MSNVDEIIGRESVRNPNHVRVLFRSHESLVIRISDWVDLDLKIPLPLTEALLKELRMRASQSEAVALAERYLRGRTRTEQQVKQYLRRQGVLDEYITGAVLDLRKRGVVNDALYAELYRDQKKGVLSRREITWRLVQKGIQRDVAELSDGTGAEEDEEHAAFKVAEKYARRHRSDDNLRLKLSAFLQRKGYPVHMIQRVVAQLLDTKLD